MRARGRGQSGSAPHAAPLTATTIDPEEEPDERNTHTSPTTRTDTTTTAALAPGSMPLRATEAQLLPVDDSTSQSAAVDAGDGDVLGAVVGDSSTVAAAAANGFKLFVGSIPLSCTDADLRAAFEPRGEIIDLVILKEKLTRASKGCGFVVFQLSSSADRAIAELGGSLALPDAQSGLIVRYAGPRPDEAHKLYVSMLSPESTETDLHKLFSPFGSVTDLVVLRQKEPPYTSKGSAFVKYATIKSAQEALAALDHTALDPHTGSPLQVRFAHTHEEKIQHFRRETGAANALGTDHRNQRRPSFADGHHLQEQTTSHTAASHQHQLTVSDSLLLQQWNQQAADHALMQNLLAQHHQQQQQHQQQQHQQLTASPRFSYSQPQSPHSPLMHPLTAPHSASPHATQLVRMMGHTTSRTVPSFPAPMLRQLQLQQQYSASAQPSPTVYAASSSPTYHPYGGGTFFDANSLAHLNHSMPSHGGLNTDARGPDGGNLFVYNIPESFFESDLLQLFGVYGRVLSTKVQRDRHTGASKGFGFVSFESPLSAQHAIARLNDCLLLGRRLSVRLKSSRDASSSSSSSSSSQYCGASSHPSQQMYGYASGASSSASGAHFSLLGGVANLPSPASSSTSSSSFFPSTPSSPSHVVSPTLDQMLLAQLYISGGAQMQTPTHTHHQLVEAAAHQMTTQPYDGLVGNRAFLPQMTQQQQHGMASQAAAAQGHLALLLQPSPLQSQSSHQAPPLAAYPPGTPGSLVFGPAKP